MAAETTLDTWESVSDVILREARALGEGASVVRPFQVEVPLASEILFGGESLLDEGSEYDTTYLESAWQQQNQLTPLLAQPAHPISRIWGDLVLRGTAFPRETVGRWTRLDKPFSLQFRVPGVEALSAYVCLSSGSSEAPALVSVRGDCHPETLWVGDIGLMKLHLRPTQNGEVHLEFEVQRRTRLDDDRQLGVLLRSLVLFEHHDYRAMLAVVEAQAGIRGTLYPPKL
jgi:hypothetical protein